MKKCYAVFSRFKNCIKDIQWKHIAYYRVSIQLWYFCFKMFFSFFLLHSLTIKETWKPKHFEITTTRLIYFFFNNLIKSEGKIFFCDSRMPASDTCFHYLIIEGRKSFALLT